MLAVTLKDRGMPCQAQLSAACASQGHSAAPHVFKAFGESLRKLGGQVADREPADGLALIARSGDGIRTNDRCEPHVPMC